MQPQSAKKGLLSITRILSVVGGIALILVIFLPIWRIELDAPQYPEGLVMTIHANKLAGDVEIINGLNHYIGMRTLHADDFVEFAVLPYILALLGLFGLLTAFVNKKWFFFVWAGSLVLFAILSMIDFYMWEYNYGHNLDPTAPIQVPGMAYQPPLIGFKQLLNFGAYSIPDLGGWLMFGVGFMLLFLAYFEIKKMKKHA